MTDLLENTPFDKDKFEWDGMYLMYNGEHNRATYYIATADTHPSRVGTARVTFIARFKYGRKPWKTWVNFIAKNFTVEEYVRMSDDTSPLEAVKAKGFVDGKRYR